jgi:surface polysaccharide O-acyltransferase-like enzyme
MKGIGFCLMAGADYATSGYYLYSAFIKASGTDKKGKLIIAGLLFMVGAIVHVIGIVEAYNDAVTFNEKRFYYGENKSQSPYIARLVKQRK